MFLSLLSFLLVRRKECIYHQHIIVRALLPWVARETQDFASLLGWRIVISDGNGRMLYVGNQSRDAKFCVSQARLRNKQMRNMSVNAALFARETQGWAINKCDYIPGIAAFFARETQDFASLQG